MEALIALLVLVALAVPLLLVMALVMIAGLRRRVGALERALGDAAQAPAGAQASAATERDSDPAPAIAGTDAVAPAAGRMPQDVPAPGSAAAAAGITAHPPPPASVAEGTLPPPLPPRVPRAAAPVPAPTPRAAEGPGAIERMLAGARRWFSEGNVPVKIGMLVFLAGIAALLKYVSDQGLLQLPVELRLAAIALAALAMLAFGWRQRGRRRMFALALQGGAIGVLLLTVFAAFKRYELLPAAAAFASSIALVAGLCVLAVAQNSRTLAVLGILAGFMAPLWLSTGSGNHVGLFSYYAVLNAGVFVIAWYRPWRALNLLGFAFTFGIGVLWGVLQYRPQDLPTTQPFLVLFFAFYLLIPLMYARRLPAGRRGLVDGSLLFGTPLVAFSLQAAMVHDQPMLLAAIALGVALLYAALARLLIARPAYTLLAQAHAVLAVGFATLAVPLALSARATGAVFALEGAGLVWLGLRQQRRLPQVAGALLQVAAAFAFVAGADHWHTDARMLLNATAMGALLLAAAAFASAWAYHRHGREGRALVYYLWGLLWWLGGLSHELIRFNGMRVQPDALLVLVAVTAWLAAEVHRRQPARALALTTLCMLAAGFPLLLWQNAVHHHPFAGYGALTWLVMAVLGARALQALRSGADAAAGMAQFLWWLLWPSVLSAAAMWLAERAGLAQGWAVLLVLLPWGVLAGLSIWRWRWVSLPLGPAFDPVRPWLQCLLFALLGVAWLRVHLLPGWAAPLPWLPLLNPAELSQWAILLLAARWLYAGHAPQPLRRARVPLLAVAGFIGLTSTVLHGVHHWGHEAWNATLWRSSLAQTSLTVLWSVLGVMAWVWGSRRGQRVLWTVGAVLMAVVLAKLVLIDRQHLGNLLGIASFMAYGLLCTAVGYLAPAPPRQPTPRESTT